MSLPDFLCRKYVSRPPGTQKSGHSTQKKQTREIHVPSSSSLIASLNTNSLMQSIEDINICILQTHPILQTWPYVRMPDLLACNSGTLVILRTIAGLGSRRHLPFAAPRTRRCHKRVIASVM